MTSPALQCQDLRKSYGQHAVLKGINLKVEQGSIHGLVGLNGAGKTTTLECVLGLQSSDAGEISLLGFGPEHLYSAHGKIAVVFDSPCLHPHLTVRQCLNYARLACPNTSMSAEQLEKLLGIERYSHFKVRQLSLGNRRRTSIAQALINQPQLIILDEPFNGLDAGGVDDVLKLIQQLNKDHGTSFLLASHQLSYLEKICTHMAILHNGQICLSETMSNLLNSDETVVIVHTSNDNQARVVLGQIDGIELLSNNNDLTSATDSTSGILCRLGNLSSSQLNAQLVKLGVEVEQLILQKPSLESLFYATIEEQE